jgi:5-methylcytosine-specific restriction endonuclease McrA
MTPKRNAGEGTQVKPLACCSVCGRYRSIRDGLLVVHTPHGIRCDGSLKPPRALKPRTAPTWQSIRRAVIKRDKQCQKCGSTTGLEAHHKIERSDGGADTLENLIALCSLCHDEWTVLESIGFDAWLLVPPARHLVAIFAATWPDSVSAFDFKFQVLELLDAARKSTQ